MCGYGIDCFLHLLWQMSFYEVKWLEQCSKEFKPVFYRRYVDDFFVLFKLAEHILKFQDIIILMLVIQTYFSCEQEKKAKLSFLDLEVSWEKRKFVATLYRNPTFSGMYTHFESFLLAIYKLGMVYTLFILLPLIVVSKFFLMGQSFMKNSVFWNKYF